MKRLSRFFRRVARQPRTSAAGLAALAGIGFAAYRDPTVLARPETLATLTAALGLIGAADRPKDDDDPPPPSAPASEWPRQRKPEPVWEMPAKGAELRCA